VLRPNLSAPTIQSHLPPRISIPIIECFPILSLITSSDIERNCFGVGYYQFRRNGHNWLGAVHIVGCPSVVPMVDGGFVRVFVAAYFEGAD
jgi:hypothetical protein